MNNDFFFLYFFLCKWSGEVVKIAMLGRLEVPHSFVQTSSVLQCDVPLCLAGMDEKKLRNLQKQYHPDKSDEDAIVSKYLNALVERVRTGRYDEDRGWLKEQVKQDRQKYELWQQQQRDHKRQTAEENAQIASLQRRSEKLEREVARMQSEALHEPCRTRDVVRQSKRNAVCPNEFAIACQVVLNHESCRAKKKVRMQNELKKIMRGKHSICNKIPVFESNPEFVKQLFAALREGGAKDCAFPLRKWSSRNGYAKDKK